VAGFVRTSVRLLAFAILALAEVGLVRTATNRDASDFWWLLLYWAGATVVVWISCKLIDHFGSSDLVRIFRPLLISFFFFPLWFFWGFTPLPFAFFAVFPTGPAALGILLISFVWVPFGVVLLLLSRSLWRSFWSGMKSLFASSEKPSGTGA
jgi:hypothetical protein